MMKYNKGHMKCMLWKGLWLLGTISLLLAWIALYSKTLILGFDPGAWFLSGMTFATLSIPIKLDCTSCDGCSVSDIIKKD